MDPSRRRTLKSLAAGTAGLWMAGPPAAGFLAHGPTTFAATPGEAAGSPVRPVFPFLPDVKRYQMGEYLPKDQGGKFIQMQVLKTEDDEAIVTAIRGGILERTYGNPLAWGALEKTELEKSVWLNRFYCLPSFARLYHLTGDRTYLNDLMAFLRRWIAENPRDGNPSVSRYNWFDMQVAWRAIHLSWCYYLAEGGWSEEEREILAATLEEHAGILSQDFGEKALNEFNHQAHGALAMLYLGILFPRIPRAEGLVERGRQILEHHIARAFYEDGGNVEHMFGYYPFEASIFRDAHRLCTANGLTPPAGSLSLMEKMITYLTHIAQPDGTMPPVNDSYPMPVGPILHTLSAATGLSSRKAFAPGSRLFPDAQVGVMRSRPEKAGESPIGTDLPPSWYLLAHPAKTMGSHAHAGRLGFVAWYRDRPVCIESGCTSYDDPLLVSWYRTSRAHNTVLIDGLQDRPTSSDDLWVAGRETGNRITGWIEKENCRMVRMTSPAAEEANRGVEWVRSLALVQNDFLIVYDCFTAPEPHEYEILLHLPPGDVTLDPVRKSARLAGTPALAIVPSRADQHEELTRTGGWIGIEGGNVPAPVLSYRCRGNEIHSVLVVAPEPQPSQPLEVSEEQTPDGLCLTIRSETRTATVLLAKPHATSFRHRGREATDGIEVIESSPA
ncbi:MAG: alginate lyase family protein [Bacteroidales bacterium]